MTDEIIDGKYRVVSLLGQGGMGRVYRARHMDLDIDVAVKVIIPDHGSDQNLLHQRFDQEAKAMARLNHPNIIDVKDYSSDKMYIVMEYLEGETLEEKIKRGNALPVHEALSIFKQILAALEYAHKRSIIHRDMKPANIFLTTENVAKVMDFGLAAIRSTGGATRTMIIAGTPTYEAPEQKKGLGFADHRSDIYSTGIALYEALAGKLPSADDPDDEIRKAVVEGRIPDLGKTRRDLPEELTRVVMKAIREEPGKRFQTAAEMKAALESVRIPDQAEQTTARISGRRRVKYLAYGIVIAAIIMVITQTDILNRPDPGPVTDWPSISIRSIPPESEVSLGGTVLGLTPLENRTVDTTGSFALRIQKEGYLSWDTTVILARGEAVSVDKRLNQVAGPVQDDQKEAAVTASGNGSQEEAAAVLTLRAIPQGKIFVDGVAREGAVTVSAGRHIVGFEHTSLGRKDTTIRLNPGENRLMECYFEGIVSVTAVDEAGSPVPGSFIWIDDTNTLLETPWQVRLPAGTHSISVTKSGFELVGKAQTIRIEPSLQKRPEYRLRFTVRRI